MDSNDIRVLTVKDLSQKFYKAADVASILGVSETTAYRMIRSMNQDLKKQGFYIVAGKISKRYFEEKICM